jgi:hypothetical protein
MQTQPILSRYLLFLFITFLVSSFYLPAHYDIPYPQTLDPQFKPNVKREYIDAISLNRPGLVLIGDSVLYLGIDQESLSEQLGVETYSVGVPGSGSAVWYLILKNVVLGASHRPKYAVVVFRDTMLTTPAFRTTGRYFGLLDDFAGRREPLVAQLAFIDQMSPIEKLAEQYLPLYSARWEIREGLDSRIRYTSPYLLLDCSAECTDEAMNSIFGRERVDVVALNQAVEGAGETLYAPEAMDFDEQIDRSFLPATIQLAQDNEITLIFVRTRTLMFPVDSSEPVALRNYMESLEAYISGHGAHYLDFAHDERIKDEYFFDLLHFNAAGQDVFTQILADELKVFLE